METKIVFIGGGEIRVHEEMDKVRDRFLAESRNWARFDRPGTKPHPVCVNPANVAYLEAVSEIEPSLEAN